MTFTVNLTNGTLFATVQDTTINTTASTFSLVGHGAIGYAKPHAENFIHIAENSANTVAPSNPLTGQLWYDTTVKYLKIWNGSSWVVIGGYNVVQTVNVTDDSNNVATTDYVVQRIAYTFATALYAYNGVPNVDTSAGSPGTSVLWARGDHAHPTPPHASIPSSPTNPPIAVPGDYYWNTIDDILLMYIFDGLSYYWVDIS